MLRSTDPHVAGSVIEQDEVNYSQRSFLIGSHHVVALDGRPMKAETSPPLAPER